CEPPAEPLTVGIEVLPTGQLAADRDDLALHEALAFPRIVLGRLSGQSSSDCRGGRTASGFGRLQSLLMIRTPGQNRRGAAGSLWCRRLAVVQAARLRSGSRRAACTTIVVHIPEYRDDSRFASGPARGDSKMDDAQGGEETGEAGKDLR